MQRPSKKWLESIAVKICILLLAAYPSIVLAQNDVEKSRSEAQNAAGSVYEYLGTGEAINQNAAQPLTSSKTPMKTIDQSKSFSAQLSCPSSSKFVDILVQPGSTGDLEMVMVLQDTNLGGEMDYQYNMPFPVSGICGNGVIQCDVGTWKNCKYWKWVADNQGKVSIQQTDLTKMGGCYCINNSCGNNVAWSNLPLILKDLGAGATGAIMSTNPKYSITDVKVSDAEITYYSQSLTECGTPGSASGTNPANYYAGGMTDAPITGAAQQEVTTEQTDPDSMYSVMSNAMQYHNTLGQMVQCKIIRNITITQQVTCPYGNAALNSDSTVCTENGNSCSSYCGTVSGCQITKNPINIQGNWFGGWLFRLWGSGQNIIGEGFGVDGTIITIPGVNMSGGTNSIYPDFIMDIRGSGENLQIIRCTNINMADHVREYGWGVIYASNKEDIVCTVAGEINIPGATMTMDEDPLIKGGPGLYYVGGVYGILVNGNKLSILHNGYNPYWDYYYSGSYWDSYWWGRYGGNDIYLWKQYCTYPASRIDTINESINDQCTALEENPKCQIQDEQVDNVYTYKNYQPTGLIPIATCKDYNGFYYHNICRDWWEKDRTYLCQGDSKFDFTDSMKRVSEVYKTTKDTNGIATYTDYRQDDKTKTWQTEGNTFDLGVARSQPYDTCSKVCKTRKLKQDTQATQSGTTSQYRKDITTYEFYYRQCYPQANVCPAGAGEEILKDCQCIDEFAETFTLLETLKEAGEDAICSSGAKK